MSTRLKRTAVVLAIVFAAAQLAEACQDVSNGKMPGAYTALRPETRLSARDAETVCAAASQAAEEQP